MKKIPILLLTLSIWCESYAGFCPTNFRMIDAGYSVDSVINNCGPPESRRIYYKEYETNVSVPIGGGTGTTTAVRRGNVINSYSNYSQPTYVSKREVNRIEITELLYPNGVVLQFVDGKLIEEN